MIKQLLFFTVFIFLIFLTLPSVSVFGSSEAREIHLSAVIREADSIPLVPKRGDFVPSKPPLFHYICGGIGKLLPHEVQMEVITRGVSLLSALLIVFTTFLISRNLNTSSLSIYLLLSSHLFLSSALDSKVDTLMNLFVVAGIYAGITRKYFFYVPFLTLGILTKGPLPFLITILGVLCFEKKPLLLNRNFLLISFIGGVCGCAWYLMAYVGGDTETIVRQLWFENVARMIGNENIAPKPWYFLFKSFLLAEPHLCIAVIGAALYGGFKGLTYGYVRSGIFFVFTLVLLSFSSGKRSSYILPVLPFFSIWLAGGIEKACSELTDVQWRKVISSGRTLKSIALVIILSMLFGYEFLKRIPLRDTQTFTLIAEYFASHGIYFQLLLLFALVHGLLSSSAKYNYPILFISLWIGLSWAGSGIKGELRGFKKASQQIHQITNGEKILLKRDRYDEYLDPIFYYLRDIIITSGDAPYTLGKKNDLTNSTNPLFTHRQIGDIRAGNYEREILLIQNE